MSVRRESESDTQSTNTQDSMVVNIGTDEQQESTQKVGYQEVVKDDGKQEVVKIDVKQEVVKDDGKQEEVNEDGNGQEVKDDGKQEFETDRQFEHVDVEVDVKDEGSDTCEGFVVYAKHKDSDDVVEVEKQEDKKVCEIAK